MSDFSNSEPAEPVPAPSSSRAPGLISSASAPGSGRVSEVWAESSEQASHADVAPDEPEATATIDLSATECRVIGALIEKSFLTPDVYPMTTNGLVTACNQKTNRDPVVDYSAVLIDSTLLELRQRNLVRRVHTPGSRSTKHRQTLDEALSLSEQQLALMSVLLLRGPQTVGELRLRTERHDVGFDDLDAVQHCLDALAGRSTPLVVQLDRQPGHKENRWQHLLADEAGADITDDTSQNAPVSAPPSPASANQPAPAAAPIAADADLVTRVAELESQVETLHRQLASLADKLGEPLD